MLLCHSIKFLHDLKKIFCGDTLDKVEQEFRILNEVVLLVLVPKVENTSTTIGQHTIILQFYTTSPKHSI